MSPVLTVLIISNVIISNVIMSNVIISNVIISNVIISNVIISNVIISNVIKSIVIVSFPCIIQSTMTVRENFIQFQLIPQCSYLHCLSQLRAYLEHST